MMYRYDDTLKRLVPVAFTITKIVEVNPFVFELNFSDVFTLPTINLSGFSLAMQSMSDSLVSELISPNSESLSDTYTPMSVDLSSFSVSLGSLTENMTTGIS